MTTTTERDVQHGFNVAHGHGPGSSLHRSVSFDVTDHPMPTGQERDPLLLAPGELVGIGVRLVRQHASARSASGPSSCLGSGIARALAMQP